MIKYDKDKVYRFASLQSSLGQELLEANNLKSLDSVILLEGDQLLTHADVALKIASRLGGYWKLAGFLNIFPSVIRNKFYDWIARNRYKWFGKKEMCMVPSNELKALFLDI